MQQTAEHLRLKEHYAGEKNWLQWGCYLSERQWGTVREDYSAAGDAWNYFTHQQAASRVYRWGEDGIAGISDENQYLCFALAMWNGKDPILKERLFGLTNSEGNHGEDVKELYYYLDNTPAHSYMKCLYKYPQAAFPYNDLLITNRNRTKQDPEYELADTGIFDENKYFDISTEYAKAAPDDILIRITISNRADEAATLHLLPTLWFRNTWKYNITKQTVAMALQNDGKSIKTQHEKLPPYFLYFQTPDKVLFTENKNNKKLLWNTEDKHPFRKNAFHKALIENNFDFLEGKTEGTKAAPLYILHLNAKEETEICLRLTTTASSAPFDETFTTCFINRKQEADEFYQVLQLQNHNPLFANMYRQALAGMLWSKQFYYYNVEEWLQGDVQQPQPPAQRLTERNSSWPWLKAADIISMPDKWEYPWFAAWDLALHCMVLAEADINFAKKQLLLLFNNNYASPDGQLPAYEWNFSDVNPPVQALAAIHIYKKEKQQTGQIDFTFLENIYSGLLKNYTWWLTRQDRNNNNVFEGGFLGLDNISVFDRSSGLPPGAKLDQADGTAWVALFSLNMLEIALELCKKNNSYENDCINYFNNFVKIADSLQKIAAIWADDNTLDDGFFYDVLQLPGAQSIPVKLRSIAGVIPLLAVMCLTQEQLKAAPRLQKLLTTFENTNQLYQIISFHKTQKITQLSLLSQQQLKALLNVLFDEEEMLAPGGIRSVSKVYENEFTITVESKNYTLKYMPGESDNGLYGGNSNWRGPVWMPLNFLITRALNTYADFYNEQISFTASGKQYTIHTAAAELSARLINIFLPDKFGNRPVHGKQPLYKTTYFENLILFYEHFHAETSQGIGASHQTGWTGLAAIL